MYTLQAGAQHAIAFSGIDDGGDASEGNTPTLRKGGEGGQGQAMAIAFTQNSRSEVRELGDKTGAVTSEPGAQCQNYLKSGASVRRLTPRECERLQGFPDDYTQISAATSDGPRYKAIGNSMAVPVMRWIGERIQKVEENIS